FGRIFIRNADTFNGVSSVLIKDEIAHPLSHRFFGDFKTSAAKKWGGRGFLNHIDVEKDEISFLDWAVSDALPVCKEELDLANCFIDLIVIDFRTLDGLHLHLLGVDVRYFRFRFKGKIEECSA